MEQTTITPPYHLLRLGRKFAGRCKHCGTVSTHFMTSGMVASWAGHHACVSAEPSATVRRDDPISSRGASGRVARNAVRPGDSGLTPTDSPAGTVKRKGVMKRLLGIFGVTLALLGFSAPASAAASWECVNPGIYFVNGRTPSSVAFAVSLPAGTYDFTFRTSDAYDTRADSAPASQAHEKVRIFGVTSQDLVDGIPSASTNTNGRVVLDSAIETATADHIHGKGPDSVTLTEFCYSAVTVEPAPTTTTPAPTTTEPELIPAPTVTEPAPTTTTINWSSGSETVCELEPELCEPTTTAVTEPELIPAPTVTEPLAIAEPLTQLPVTGGSLRNWLILAAAMLAAGGLAMKLAHSLATYDDRQP